MASVGTTGEDAASVGYGGRSGYGAQTRYPGASSGSHRRPDPASATPGATAAPGSASPAGSTGPGYPPGAAGYAPASPVGTGYLPSTPGGAEAAPGPGSGRGTGRRRDPAGDSEPGAGASRAGRQAPPAVSGGPPSRENAWRRPDRRPGQEIQGGPGNGPGNGGPSSRGSLWSAGAFRTAGPGGRGPVRGFPPAPGAPDPVYPPGQFSPWNAPALRAVSAAGRPGLATGSDPETSEPGYSLLAVSDPSADATATQTWAVLDDALLDDWSAATADAPARAGQGESGPPAASGGRAGTRGFFEPGGGGATSSWVAPSGAATSPYAGQAGTPGYLGEPGYSGQRVYPGQPGLPDDPGFSGDTGDADSPRVPGEAGYPGQTDPSLRTARPGGRLAARQGRQQSLPDVVRETREPGTGAGATTGSRSAARGGKPRKPRKPPSRARMWLMPLAMMVIVIAGITVAYLHFAKGQSSVPAAAPAAGQADASGTSPALGPWKHITTRAEDPAALSLTELFPAQYSASGTVVRTVQRAGHNCPGMALGSRLRAALRKADCTQVMRASYLSAGQKIMATIGVLNLANVTDAERAGKATGATAFIKQLPGAHGPTRNLVKGTGLEEAQFKGHYLILTWAEFTNLRTPSSAARRTELDTFSRQLVASTAGISLTSRMVFGKPEIP